MLKRTHTKRTVRDFSIKLISCFSMLSLIFSSQAYGGKKQEYIFTTDIYNQNDVLTRISRSKFSEDQENHELEKELLRRKEVELEKTFLNRINERIAKLEEEFEEASKSQFRIKIGEALESSATMAPFAGMLIGGAIGSVVPVAGTTMGTAFGLGVGVIVTTSASIGNKFIEKKTNNTRIKKTDPQIINKEIRDLEAEYAKLKEGLKHEPLAEIERRYIAKKRHIHAAELHSEIERSLIQARVADYFFQINAPAIGSALGLPLRPKPLLDPNNLDESKGDLIERFEREESFSIYAENIKNSLREVIMQIAVNSVTPTISESPLRVVEHWLGSGATGKSTAAKAIASFLGLPYFEQRITSPETEINMASISGVLRSFQGSPILGWLAEALLQKTEGANKESYENTFLILDDFPVNTQNGQNTLLAITDPERRTLRNNYFQADLNISRLNLFIISNEDFKSLKPAPENDPTFDALRSRFRTTKFPEFTEEQKGRIAKPYLEETLVKKHKPPFFYKFKYVDPTKIEMNYDSQALVNMGFKKEDDTSVSIPTGVPSNRRSSISPTEKITDKISSSFHANITFRMKETNELFDLHEKALQKDPESCFSLGKYLYEEEWNKKDGKQNIEKYKSARRWLQDAADKGHPGAKEYLDKISEISKQPENQFSNKASNDFPSTSITIRELKRELENTINSYLTDLLKKRKLAFMEWENLIKTNTDDNLKNADDWLKKAALLGHPNAVESLKAIKDDQIDLQMLSLIYQVAAEAEVEDEQAQQVGLFLEAEENLNKAKKWCKKAVELGSPTAASWFCAYFGKCDPEKLGEEDYQVLSTLFSNNKELKITIRLKESLQTISDKLAVALEDPGKINMAYTVLRNLLKIGYHEAIPLFYQWGEKIERKEGLGSSNAIASYSGAAEEGHEMALFKLGWLAWKKKDHKLALSYAEKSSSKQCGWGHYLFGILLEEEKEWSKAQDQYEKARKKGNIFSEHKIRVLHPEYTAPVDPVLEYIKPIESHVYSNEEAVSLVNAFQSADIKEEFFGFYAEFFHFLSDVKMSWWYHSSSHLLFLLTNPTLKKTQEVWLKRARKLEQANKL